jgi:hypothetical protein
VAGALSTGEFLESALMLFLAHFRPFLSAAILGLSPVLGLGLLAAMNALGHVYGHPLLPRSAAGPALAGSLLILAIGSGMLIVQGAVVPAVMQAVVAPLRPIDVASLRRRFRPRLLVYVRSVAPLLAFFVAYAACQLLAHVLTRSLPALRDPRGALEVAGAVLVGLLPSLPVLALLASLARSGSARGLQLIASVAVVEGLPPRQTIARATQLVASCPGPLRAARVAVILAAASVCLGGVTALVLLSRHLPGVVALGVIGIPASLAFVLLAPLLAVISALTYLRARRALGEPLDKAFQEFERAVLPESHWRLAERERIATQIASRR